MIKGIWCPKGSKTARMLAQTLGVQRVRREREVLENLLLLHPPPKESILRRCLNDRMCWGKLRQHLVLAGAGLPTLRVAIFPPGEGWIPRSAEHARGDDFDGKPVRAAYYTFWEDVEKEFRFHIVGGSSVKAGGKVPRLGMGMVHPTIRSGQFGWAISYGAIGREGITKEMRELAKEAAGVCQMDAGVVDVWQLRDGKILVGELNVRPGMDQPTVEAWAAALRRME